MTTSIAKKLMPGHISICPARYVGLSAAMLMTPLTLALTLIQSFCLIAISDFMVNKKFKLNDGKSHLRKKKESKQYCNSNKNYSSLLGAWIHQDMKCGVAHRPL